MDKTTPYNIVGLCNDLENLMEQNRLQSSYFKADIKTVNIRVNQLMRNDALLTAQWNYTVELMKSPDYALNESNQLRVGGVLYEMLFDLYVRLSKEDQAGLYLSPETLIYIQYRLNSKK